jgi:hypothetical protein
VQQRIRALVRTKEKSLFNFLTEKRERPELRLNGQMRQALSICVSGMIVSPSHGPSYTLMKGVLGATGSYVDGRESFDTMIPWLQTRGRTNSAGGEKKHTSRDALQFWRRILVNHFRNV